MSSFVGGGLAVLHRFSLESMIGLGIATVGFWLVSIMILDHKRLVDQKRVLTEMASDQRNYELIVDGLRRERDDLQKLLARAQAETEATRAVYLAVRALSVTQTPGRVPDEGDSDD